MLGKLLHTRSRDFGFEPHIVYTDDNWEVLLASLATFNSICIMAHEYKEFYSDASLTWIPLDDKKSFFPYWSGLSSKSNLFAKYNRINRIIARFVSFYLYLLYNVCDFFTN